MPVPAGGYSIGMDRFSEAFQRTPREYFLPDEVYEQAYHDVALPIGFGQTNSQPTTVRWMLEWLEPEESDTVLDVGSGSGWTSALLSRLVEPDGVVYAVEKIPELVEIGRENCRRLGIENIRFHRAGDAYGLPEYAPYDRILVSATAEEVPQELLDQLKPGGRLVIPVGQSIRIIEKTPEGAYETSERSGFLFVPLVR